MAYYYMGINMSGKSFPVYKEWPRQNNPTKIGTIYAREAFAFHEGLEDGSAELWFRDSSGKLVQGFIYDWAGSELTECIDYPYTTDDDIDGKGTLYYIFKFRRSEEVYTAAGNRWGTVASGMEVACQTAMMGDNHPDWKGINYVKRSSDGKWIKVTGDGYDYGFVDVGLNQGSTPSTISMYGTW